MQAAQSHADYRTRLDAAVTAFSLFIRGRCREAHLEISFARYEDEDAHIWVTVPTALTPTQREGLANAMAQRSLDVLLEDGLCILPGIEEPDEDEPTPAPEVSRGAQRQRRPRRRRP